MAPPHVRSTSTVRRLDDDPDAFSTASIRSAALRALRTAVTERGGDPHRYARLAGLAPRALDGHSVGVTVHQMGALLKYAAIDLGCPDLGLRVAEHQDLSALGPLGWVIGSCDTIDDAFAWMDRYCLLRAPGAVLRREPDPRQSPGILGLHLQFSGVGVLSPHLTDWSLGLLHRSIVELLGGAYDLLSVEMSCAPASVDVYETFFGAPVRTGPAHAVLRVPATVLKRPIRGSNPHVVRLAEAMLGEHSRPVTTRAAAEIRSEIRRGLGTPGPTIDAVAARLSVHPRTLQRHLAAEGTTYATVLDDVRRAEADRYLRATDLPLTRIAAALGLSSQSALTRCCRRWWARTPTQVRTEPRNR